MVNWQLQLRGDGPPGTHPSIDVAGSFNRREDLLVVDEELERRRAWRLGIGDDPRKEAEAMEALFQPSAQPQP